MGLALPTVGSLDLLVLLKFSRDLIRSCPKVLTWAVFVAKIFIAYVPRATANDRGSWSLSPVFDTATIGSAQSFGPPAPLRAAQPFG